MKYMNFISDMMRPKFALMAVCLMAAPVFTACSDDDDDDDRPSREECPEEVEVYRFDQQNFLQQSIVKIDEEGNWVCRKYGKPLDEADSTCLSVQAATMEEAKTSFKSLFSTDASFTENGDKITVALKDENDKSQGTVVFEPVTAAEDGAFAHVTFNTTPEMLYVSEIRYTTEWEDNDLEFSPHSVGDKVSIKIDTPYEQGNRDFVCIREATPGRSGVLIYISNKRYCGDVHGNGKGGSRNYIYADKSDAKLVSEIMRSNWNYYNTVLKNGGQPYDRDFSVWYEDTDWYLVVEYRHWIRLKTGDTGKNDVKWGSKEREFLLVKHFNTVVLN